MTASQERQNRAAVLRAQGYTFRSIAEVLSYSSPQAARQAVLASQRRATTIVTGATWTPRATGDRAFGIEIEFFGISSNTALDALTTAGLNVDRQSYNHNTCPTWKLVTDATVNGSGLELVSPKLSGESGYAEVMLAMTTLKAAGAVVNHSCGMHVHHDAEDLTGHEIASLMELYVGRQDAIDQLVAPSRRGTIYNTWCQRVDPRELSRIVTSLRAERRPPVGHGNGNSQYRYRTINVQAMLRHGTVEIRQHQGSLNGEKAIAWIKFGQALIRSAQSNASQAVPNTVFEMLQSLATNHGLDTATAEYLITRAFHFANNS